MDHPVHRDRQGGPGLRAARRTNGWPTGRRPGESRHGLTRLRQRRTPREAAWAGIGRTSIDKQPVAGPVLARRLGLDGDQVSDTRHHGGVDQAVYAFAREDLDCWAGELGQEIRDGQFGENLTTLGIDVNEAEVGERWRIGDALLEVASVRIPCNDFKCWMGRSRLRQPGLGQAVRRRGPARPLPAGPRARATLARGRRDRGRAPARPRRHREHHVPRR